MRGKVKEPESAKDIEELDAMEIQEELEQDIRMDPVQTANVLKRSINNQVKHVKSWDDDVHNMNKALAKDNMVGGMEVYSPKRVNGMAEILGLLLGMSSDLSELSFWKAMGAS